MDNDGRQHRNSNEPRPSTPGHSQVPAGSQVNPSSMDSLIAGFSNLQSPTRPIFSRILPVVTHNSVDRQSSSSNQRGHHGGSMDRNVAHSSRASFPGDYNMRMPREEPIPTLNDLMYPPSEIPNEIPIPMRRVEISRKRFHSSSSHPTSSEHQRLLERGWNNLIYTPTFYYVFPKRTKLETMRNVSNQVSPGRVDTRFQRTPQFRAFNMHVISHVIFKKVSMDDLKSCRLVSKLMNKMSSRIMESRLKTVSLTYKFHWGLGKFVRDSLNNAAADPTTREYLETLNTCLDMSKKGHHFNSFPCSNFIFHLGDMNSPDIKNVFELYGHRVKTLSITYEESVDVSGLPQLKQLLRVLNQIPHIVTLDLPWFYQPDDLVKVLKADIMVEDHVQTELSSLKTLRFACSAGFNCLLKKVMDAAPNLEDLNKACSHLLEVLVEDEKMSLLKIYEFSPDDSNLALLDRMSEAELAIKTLRIDLTQTHGKPETWSQVAKIFKNFLESTQNTLIDLSTTPLAFLPEFQLPDLQQLKTLEFYAPHKAHEKSLYKNVAFLPTATNIFRVMMNLTTLKFNCEVTSLLRNCIDDYFPRDNNSVQQFVNVTTLECGLSSTEVHARLAELFPKVKQLKLNLSNSHLKSLWVIWNNWEAIQFLELNDAIIDYADDRPAILDSVFTGIPASQCVTLRQKKKVQKRTWEQGPSVTKLKQLKSLVLKVGEVRKWPTTYESNPFFSHVSFLYGFNMIPQLKVIVDISTQSHQDYITRALKPCLPNITLKV